MVFMHIQNEPVCSRGSQHRKRCPGPCTSLYANCMLCYSDLGIHWFWSFSNLSSSHSHYSYSGGLVGAQITVLGTKHNWTLFLLDAWSHLRIGHMIQSEAREVWILILQRELTISLPYIILRDCKSWSCCHLLLSQGEILSEEGPNMEKTEVRDGEKVTRFCPWSSHAWKQSLEYLVTWDCCITHFGSGFLSFATERVLTEIVINLLIIIVAFPISQGCLG